MSGGARQLFDPEALPEAAGPERPRPTAGGADRRGALHRRRSTTRSRGRSATAFPAEPPPVGARRDRPPLRPPLGPPLPRAWSTPRRTGAGAGSRSRGGAPTLNVKCWRSSWAPLRHGLAKQGIELAEGMVVVLRGTLDLYRAKGEISLILVEVDVTALLGRMAAQRAQLLRALEAEGLLRRNAALPLPEVAAARRAGRQSGDRGLPRLSRPADRLGVRVPRLRTSRWPSRVPGAPASIARAVTRARAAATAT